MSKQVATLLIVCKQPKLHQGKQRLAAEIGAEPTLGIAQALLDCALEDAKTWPGPVIIAPAHPDQRLWAQTLLHNAQVLPQPEGNLGQRIMAIDQQLRNLGHEQILCIGSDAPVISQAYLRSAAELLNHKDVVLSAASDGGVTIMANAKPWPDLTNLPWSTPRLNQCLQQQCCAQNLEVGYIKPSYDIDHKQDLHKLVTDLRVDPRPARQRLLTLCKNLLS